MVRHPAVRERKWRHFFHFLHPYQSHTHNAGPGIQRPDSWKCGQIERESGSPAHTVPEPGFRKRLPRHNLDGFDRSCIHADRSDQFQQSYQWAVSSGQPAARSASLLTACCRPITQRDFQLSHSPFELKNTLNFWILPGLFNLPVSGQSIKNEAVPSMKLPSDTTSGSAFSLTVTPAVVCGIKTVTTPFLMLWPDTAD